MDMLEKIANKYQAYEPADKSEFQRRSRILQSMWREEKIYPIGEQLNKHGVHKLGSRLKMPQAEDELLNYLTPSIQKVVKDEVINREKSKGKLYKKPRIFDDLLSSQPLCFNLFGELQCDLKLATSVLTAMLPDRIQRVTGIEFEYSPGRQDPKYTGDSTAFDIYVTFNNKRGKKGFLGIEVKYHEDLQGKPSPHRVRYDEIANLMRCFKYETLDRLRRKPLQQIWRDHLLSGILRFEGGFEDGFYIFLYPKDNIYCKQAVAKYRECLTNTATFKDWTLEEITSVIKNHTSAGWIGAFIDRYLNFGKLDKAAAS